MHNAPLIPQAMRGYPVDRDLVRVRRAERRARPRRSLLRIVGIRLRPGR